MRRKILINWDTLLHLADWQITRDLLNTVPMSTQANRPLLLAGEKVTAGRGCDNPAARTCSWPPTHAAEKDTRRWPLVSLLVAARLETTYVSINCQSTLYPNDNVLCSHGEDNWGGQLGPYDWLWDHLQDGDTEIRYFLLEKEKKKKKKKTPTLFVCSRREYLGNIY